MEIYLTVVFGVLGAVIGSFLNVCIDRLPAGRSLLGPPSHCESCQKRLGLADLIPVFSYLWLRGRCRYCGARIPPRSFFVELGCALLTAFLYRYKGLTPEFGIIAVYSYIYIVIGLIDLRTGLILNKIVYPSLVLALVLAPFFIRGGSGYMSNLLNALTGAGVGMVALLIPVVATMGRGMGIGDVKLAVLIGLTTGFGEVLVAILGGIILGGLAAIFLLVFKLKKRKEAIPFGPFLSIGAIVTLLWGSQILEWYLGLFRF